MLLSRLPLAGLIEVCRVLRYYLRSGLLLRDAFRQLSARGPASVRPVAARVAAHLARGVSLEEALEHEGGAFPPVWAALVRVGEQTGMLPEVLEELERYFTRQQQLRRLLLAQAAWPVLQLVAAVLVLAALTLILGFLPAVEVTPGSRYDPLGLGLSGVGGALTFLGVVFGAVAGVAAAVWLVSRLLGPRAGVQAALLKLPVVGGCLEALALARFCLSLRMTLETGMPVGQALRLSLEATGNAAFAAAVPAVRATVRQGLDLAAVLALTRLFPEEFLHIVTVGEESGRLSDVLAQQAEKYHARAGRRLTFLTVLLSVGVWLLVGAAIIAAVFRLFGSYLDLLDKLVLQL